VSATKKWSFRGIRLAFGSGNFCLDLSVIHAGFPDSFLLSTFNPMNTQSRPSLRRTAFAFASLLLAAVWFVPSVASGALVVYENFDYGASDFAITKTTTAMDGGTGLAGSWVQPTDSNSNNRGAYIADGLTFGPMPTSGGALRVEAQWAGSSIITRAIDVNVTGTLWGGWLVQTYDYEVADPNANRTSLAVGAGEGEHGYFADIDVAAKGWQADAGEAAVKIGRDSGGATAGGGPSPSRLTVRRLT